MKTESQILNAIESAYRAEYQAAADAAAFAANAAAFAATRGATREANRLNLAAEAKREALNKFREIAMRAIYPNG